MLLLNTVLLLAIILLLLSMMPARGRTHALMTAFVAAVAIIVLIIEAASLFCALSPLAITVGEALLLAGTGFFWWRSGKPDPFAALRLADLPREVRGFIAGWRLNWPYLLMIGGTLIFLLVTGLRMLGEVDADIDALTYHYPRIALWLENRTISFIAMPGREAITDLRIIEYPPISDMLFLWVFSGTKSILGLHLVEMLSMGPAMIAIYELAFRLTRKRKPALLSALIFPSFELVIWNAQHAGGAVSSIALFLAGLVFLIQSRETGERTDIILSCVGFSLAIAAKYTILYLMPVLAIILVLHLISGRRRFGKSWVIQWMVFGALCLLLLSAFFVIQNAVLYNTPIPTADRSVLMISEPVTFAGCATTNLFRITYWAFFGNTLPDSWLSQIEPLYLRVWLMLGDFFKIPWTSSYCTMEGDFGTGLRPGYSLVFVPLFLMGSFFSIKQMIIKRDFNRLLFWLLIMEFILILTGIKRIRPNNFRYLAPAAALLSVMLVDLFDRLKDRRFWLGLIVLPSLLTMTGTLSDSYQTRFAPEGIIRNETGEILDSVLGEESEIVGVFSGTGSLNALLFGEDLARPVHFTTCADLASDLETTPHTHLVLSFFYLDTSYETCLAEALFTSENRIWSVLTEDYVLRYETWYTFIGHILIFEKANIATEDELFPVSFPPGDERIFITPSLAGLVGGGPVDYILKNIGLPGDDYLFSLRAAEDDLPVTIRVSFDGETCSSDSMMYVRAYNNDSTLISDDAFEIVEDEDGQSIVTFDLSLDSGITRIFFSESNCEAEGGGSLRFFRMDVE